MVQASAPGKIILFGEHAVVYGRPAIAVPVSQIRATAVVEPSRERGVHLIAPDIAISTLLSDAGADDPLAAALRQLKLATGLARWPDMSVTVSSQIPISGGLGSGAAITAAVIRAVADFLGFSKLATDEWVSDLTFEVEKIHHGTPSGIDNTVVSYEQPVYFVRERPRNRVEPFQVSSPLHFLIADTGVKSSTRVVVEDVRRQRQEDPSRFDAMFDECGRIASAARQAIERGDVNEIGRLMTANQAVLREMTVSSREVELLVRAAMDAGASGAKLSGAGRGGNIIALVNETSKPLVRRALLAQEARGVLSSTLKSA